MRRHGWFVAAAAAASVGMATLGTAPVASAHPGTAGHLSAAQARALSRHVDQHVIVVLRAQPAGAAREAAGRVEADVVSLQRPVIAELHRTAARDVHSIPLVDAVAATVSKGEEAWLRADPAVAHVVPDLKVPLAPLTLRPATRASGAAATPPGACPANPRAVQLNPEAVELIHAASQSGKGSYAQALGYTGAGVRVGIVAGGIDVANRDYVRRNGHHVIADYRDFSNTGTAGNQGSASIESFLDASTVAAQGRTVMSLKQWIGGLAKPCNIRVLGVAPGATLDVMDVFGSAPSAYGSTVLQGESWAVLHDHVNVLNESLGFNPYPDNGAYDLGEVFNDVAVARGVTVVVAAGDAGPYNTIGSPASDAKVIAAGATTSYRAWAQLGFPSAPGVRETGWLDNNTSAMSSGGVEQNGRTLDVVAPGEINWIDCSPIPARFPYCTDNAGKPSNLQLVGGTSEAAPLTSGTAALVIQAYRESHGGASPTPAAVKQIITSTATDVHAPGDLQGDGLVNAYAAVLAARSYGKPSGAAGHAVLASADQLDAAGPAGGPVTLSDTLTNDGSSPVTVHLNTRSLSPWTPVLQGSASLSAADHFVKLERFTVPAGQARLSVPYSYTTSAPVNTSGTPVLLVLYAPNGKLAGYSWPFGTTGHGQSSVADPMPGTWTAALEAFSPTTVHVLAEDATWQSFGTVSPAALSLAPGASGSFTFSGTLPSTPGDQSAAVVVHTPGTATTVPVVLRTYVPTPAPTASFTGNVTGGNGDSPASGQTAYYQFTVPAGAPELSADISLPNRFDTALGVLVGPDGMAASTSSNSLLVDTTAGQRLTFENGLQLHTLAPAAGTWTLVVAFYDRVSGLAVSEPFGVTLSVSANPATAPGLPDAGTVALPAGSPVTVDVTVENTGSSPEEYFVDARLPGTAKMSLAPVTVPNGPVPPNGATFVAYAVPPHTTSITASARGAHPVVFDFNAGAGDPDILVNPAVPTKTPADTFAGPNGDVPSGTWIVSPEYKGPDGATGYKPGTIATSMTAITEKFDPAVTSSTGDLWQTAVNASPGANPVVADPGQTVTIPVTITPAGPAGTTVTGTLYVDSYTPTSGYPIEGVPGGPFPFASEVASFPYAYTVGS